MTRRFINSFKRAFNNPGRTVGTLLIIALIAATYGGPLFMEYHEQIKPPAAAQLLLPLELVASILTLMVCGYLLFSFFLSIDYIHAFTEHDVLNVFPTPLPRKLVFQFFLYTRGLLASTLAIVLIAYFFFRTSRSLLFSIHRDGTVGSAIAGPFLFAILFIAANSTLLIVGVLCGLSVFHKRISKKILWTLIGLVLALFLGGLLHRTLLGMTPGMQFVGELIRHTNERPFGWLLLPFRAIAASALIAYGGWTYAIPIGILVWGGLLLWCHRTLMKFTPSMYEYAVHLSQENTQRKKQFRNQMFNVKAWIEREKSKGTVDARQSRWMDEWAPTGATALFWRNAVIMRRSSIMPAIKINVLATFLFYGGIAALRVWKPGIREDGLIAFGGTVQFFVIFLFITASVGWLTETLKRFEFQKPLPISPRLTVLAELLPIAIIVSCLTLLGITLLAALFPHQLGIFLLGFVTISCSYLLMSSLLFIVLLFNPDQQDTLQRMLFGIYTIIVFVVGFLPSILTITLGFLLHFHLIVQGMMVILINATCISVLIILAAKKYESFNPAE